MSEWDPVTEGEAAMRDALRTGDQELYFRILARIELLLPVSPDALSGRVPMGWGTWTTGGRTHVLAFTSMQAMRRCLAEHVGSARTVAYHDLANAWPNEEWWLAINPGLPIEGYLPAWFVAQLSRGDVRLPGRTIGAQARVESAGAAGARARGAATVPPGGPENPELPRRVPQPDAVPPPPGVPAQRPEAQPMPQRGATAGYERPAAYRATAAPAPVSPAPVAPPTQAWGAGAENEPLPVRRPGQPPSVPGSPLPPFATAARSPSFDPRPPRPDVAPDTFAGWPEATGQPVPAAESFAGLRRDREEPTRPESPVQETSRDRGQFAQQASRDFAQFGPSAHDRAPSASDTGGFATWPDSTQEHAEPPRGEPSRPEPLSDDSRPFPTQTSFAGQQSTSGPSGFAGQQGSAGQPSFAGPGAAGEPALPRRQPREPASGDAGVFTGAAATTPAPPLAAARSAGGWPEPDTELPAPEPPDRQPGGRPGAGGFVAPAGPARPGASGFPTVPGDFGSPAVGPELRSAAASFAPPTAPGFDASIRAAEPPSPFGAPQPVAPHGSPIDPTGPGARAAFAAPPAPEAGSAPEPATTAPAARGQSAASGFQPANSVEVDLLAAATDGQTDTFLSTLLLAKVLLPLAPGSSRAVRPGDPGFEWRREDVEGQPFVTVFTSSERMAEYLPAGTETLTTKFVHLIRSWPDESWSFAVNPGTPVGATLPGGQIRALAAWAAEVGLSDEPSVDFEPIGAPKPVVSGPAAEMPVVMQKPVAPTQVAYFLERGYDRISGFVHRASEVKHLSTPEQIYGALGLGYPGSPFKPSDDEVYVLRWTAYRPNLYRIPYGGRDESGMRAMQGWVIERPPFRGNGFAPGEGDDIIAEFKVDSARLPHNAQMWRITREGKEILVAMFDADVPRWVDMSPDAPGGWEERG